MIRVRSKILSLVRLVLAAVRGEGWGVEEGGLLLEWIRLRHGTRVTVLKLSFNGRQCQKLSLSISPVFRVSIVGAFRCSSVYFARKSCLFRFVSVSPSLELADALLLVVMISRGFALSTALVLRLGLFGEIWPHNGFYLRLLKILYVSFWSNSTSLVVFSAEFSVRFAV